MPAGSPAVAPGRSRLRDPLFVGVAAIALLALGLVALLLRPRPAPATVPPIRFVLTTNDSTRPARSFPWPAAISPDGGTVVYTVAPHDANGGVLPARLYSLRTDQLEAREIPGTIGAAQPYFSPDGQWVGFEQGTQPKERKVRLDGSAPVTIANAGAYNGSDWTVHNEILLGEWGQIKGLSRVSAAGGTPVALTRVDTASGEREHLWPLSTPDGKYVVFTVWSGGLTSAQLAVAALKDGAVSRLDIKAIRPLAVLDGWLVYLKADGAVMAVRLDAGAGKVIGSPIPVHDPVPVVPGLNGNSEIYMSRGGALVTSIGSATARMSWLSPGAPPRALGPAAGEYQALRLSPDQRRVAVLAGSNGQSDIWIEDLSLGTFSRLTTVNTVTSVSWTPDGSDVLYFSTGETGNTLWRQRASGGVPPVKLVDLPFAAGGAVMSPDGRSVLLSVIPGDVWSLERLVLDSTQAVHDYLLSHASFHAPEFSPDGKWVALVDDESGQDEVYLRSYPDPSTKLQVSVGGGGAPMWSADGTRLYYLSGSALLEARLATSPALTLLGRDTVMASFPGAGLDAQYFAALYQPTRDGRRFLTAIPEQNDYQLVVAPNWITQFRRRVAESGGGR